MTADGSAPLTAGGSAPLTAWLALPEVGEFDVVLDVAVPGEVGVVEGASDGVGGAVAVRVSVQEWRRVVVNGFVGSDGVVDGSVKGRLSDFDGVALSSCRRGRGWRARAVRRRLHRC